MQACLGIALLPKSSRHKAAHTKPQTKTKKKKKKGTGNGNEAPGL